MKTVIDPGKEKRSINMVDNICFSHVEDLNGKPMDLYLSLMVQDGNSEMRLIDGEDDEISEGRQPLIVWINGAGWAGCDKNLMSAEMQFLAEHGYAVAFIDYRDSSRAHFPSQLIDCKTAVRFLRAHADQYGIDPERVGVIGRSAGGHLTAWMAMNLDGYDSEEWASFSSKVQAAVDMFGPVDIPTLTATNLTVLPSISESFEGRLLGFTDDMPRETLMELGKSASPIYHISGDMCPLAIFHGDQDPVVPCEISEDFYHRLVDAGMEDRVDLYILKHGGHGTREFFQSTTKQLIADFFDQRLN